MLLLCVGALIRTESNGHSRVNFKLTVWCRQSVEYGSEGCWWTPHCWRGPSLKGFQRWHFAWWSPFDILARIISAIMGRLMWRRLILNDVNHPRKKNKSPFLGMNCAQVNGQQQIQQIHWFRAKLTSSESARGRSQRSSRESGLWLHDWENNFLFLSFSKGQSVILNQCFHRTCSWRCHIQPLNRFMT